MGNWPGAHRYTLNGNVDKRTNEPEEYADLSCCRQTVSSPDGWSDTWLSGDSCDFGDLNGGEKWRVNDVVDLHRKYEMTQVINLSGPLTTYGASKSSEAVCTATAEGLRHHWDMEELFSRSDEVISAWSGAEAGTLTACAASGVTLSVAACMTGGNLGEVLRLPDSSHLLKTEVLLQKGHSVNFGAPIEQMIRLAGAQVQEVGAVNRTIPTQVRTGLNDRTAAAMFVVSHHTSQFG